MVEAAGVEPVDRLVISTIYQGGVTPSWLYLAPPFSTVEGFFQRKGDQKNAINICKNH